MAQRQLVHTCHTLRVVCSVIWSLCSREQQYQFLARLEPASGHAAGSPSGSLTVAEQEVYSYGCSDQEPEFRFRDPCPSYHQVHDSCDVNESNHGSYSTSKVTEPERLQMPKDDGWDASRGLSTTPPGLPSTPLSSWEPYLDTGTTTTPWVFQRYVLRKPTEAQESAPLIVEPLDMPTSSTSRGRNAIRPVQFGIFTKRLLLPHPDDEILSGYDEDVSSIRDGYTAWVKADLATILKRHLVCLDGANPVFRDAQDKKLSSPSLNYRFNTDVPNRLREQRRLSILSWNLGPRRGKADAIEKHIAGKWHIIALQETNEYLEHDYLTSHFLRDSFCWMCCMVQQGHFSLGHQSYLRLPPRYQRPAAAGRQRRAIRMGATSRHLPMHLSEGYRATATPFSP